MVSPGDAGTSRPDAAHADSVDGHTCTGICLVTTCEAGRRQTGNGSCVGGTFTCETMPCVMDAGVDSDVACVLPDGTRCPAGAECPAGDGCNSCACSAQGQLACTARSCQAPPDPSAPDAHPTPACVTSADCSASDECVYAIGCGAGVPVLVGTCMPRAFCGIAQLFCACDGVTYGACRPDRATQLAGPCPIFDAGTGTQYRYVGARIVFQMAAGVAGTGPAVIVDGSGELYAWTTTSWFDPSAVPVGYTSSRLLPPAVVNDLFDRWAATPTAALPHSGAPQVECSSSLSVRTCGTCPSSRIDYVQASQLLTEMESVYQWFDSNLVAGETTPPRYYCAIR